MKKGDYLERNYNTALSNAGMTTAKPVMGTSPSREVAFSVLSEIECCTLA